MKIAVLGATGRTGRLLIDRALSQGHEVRALARDPARLGITHSRLAVVSGDARDAGVVATLLEGCEAVASALGPSKDAPDVCSNATTHVLAAMKEKGTKRYDLVSGAGLDVPGDQKDFVGRLVSKIVRWVSPAIVADKERELALLLASDAEFVLVRPPRLVDGPAAGPPRVSTQRALGSKISRAALAEFVLAQVTDGAYVRKAPFVSA